MSFYRSYLPLMHVASAALFCLWEKHCVLISFIAQIINYTNFLHTQTKTLTAESQRLHLPSYSSSLQQPSFQENSTYHDRFLLSLGQRNPNNCFIQARH